LKCDFPRSVKKDYIHLVLICQHIFAIFLKKEKFVMISHLEKIMNDKKTTIRQLGEDSGVNNVTIMRARKDDMIERCTLGKLRQIAEALEISIHDLFDEDPSSAKKPVTENDDAMALQLENHEKRIAELEAKLKILSSLGS
jgi:DNA-binding Xre family transcriptional regulator